MDRKTTPRQQAILDVIKDFTREHGYPPSVREIGERVGLSSSSTVQCHLRTLEKKGLIKRDPTKPRALTSESDSIARDVITVPLIGRVAAGSPILAQEHIDQTYYVENTLFQRQPDYLLKVRGMSMRDAGIMDGDLLAVQATKEARNGQIVVARLGDEVTVKRLKRNKQVIELHAENPDYPTIVVQPGEPFEIEGLAVGLIRNTMLM